MTTKIVWNLDEKAALARYGLARLRATGTIPSILYAMEATLPQNRRRKIDKRLQVWFRDQVRTMKEEMDIGGAQSAFYSPLFPKPPVEPPKVEPPKVEPPKVEPPKVEPPKVKTLHIAVPTIPIELIVLELLKRPAIRHALRDALIGDVCV